MEDNASERNQVSDKLVVYSSSAACQFIKQTTRQGFHTLGIEAANKIPGSKEYDWNNKIQLQLTNRELPAFLAVLTNQLPAASWKNRGQSSKSLRIEHQGTKLFMKLSIGVPTRKEIAAPIESFDAFHVATLGLSQLGKNYPELTSDSVLSLLKSVIVSMGQAKIAAWESKKSKNP